jgi:hypothetical protein
MIINIKPDEGGVGSNEMVLRAFTVEKHERKGGVSPLLLFIKNSA